MQITQKRTQENHLDQAVIQQPKTIIFSRIEPNTTVRLHEQKALHAIVYGFQNYVNKHYSSLDDYMKVNGDNSLVVFSMSKKRFLYLAGLDNTRNTEHIKKTLNSLQNLKHTYDFSKDLGRDKYGSVAFIYRWDIDGDRIQFTLPIESRLAMLQEEPKATFCLSQVNQKFTGASKYALFLYPALSTHRQRKGEETQIVRLSDQEMRDALRVKYTMQAKGVRQYTIAPPSRLARQCIKPAVESINKAGLDYEVLNATFNKTRDGEVTWEFELKSVVEPELAKFRNEYSEDIDEVERKVSKLGLRADSRGEVLSSIQCKKSLGYVKYCLDSLAQSMAKSKAKKPAAYFWTIFSSNTEAFESDWPSIIENSKRQAEESSRNEQIRVNKELTEKRLKALESHAKKILDANPHLNESTITEELRAHLASKPNLSLYARNVYDRFEPVMASLRAKFIIQKYGGYDDEFIKGILSAVTHHNRSH